MPNALIDKLEQTTNMPREQLEQYWQRAKEIAAKKDLGERYWAYTMTIFKNMVGIKSESSGIQSLSFSDVPEWWMRRTDGAKEKYLAQHPKSRFAKQVAEERAKLAKKLKKKPEQVTLKELEAAQPKAPEAKPTKTPVSTKPVAETNAKSVPAKAEKPAVEKPAKEGTKRTTKKHSLANTISKLYNKSKKKIVTTLKKHKGGLIAIGTYASGGEITTAQRTAAKNTAKVAAALLVGALAGVALFTPLGGYVPELADHFMSFIRGGVSESSDEEKPKADLSDPKQLADAMHEWISSQDPEKLLASLKKAKGEA